MTSKTLTWSERLKILWGALQGRDIIGEEAIAKFQDSGEFKATQFLNFGQAKAPETQLIPLIKDGWRRNELIFACVDKKATTASQVALRVHSKAKTQAKDKDTELPNHPLRKLFSHPNPFMTETNFWKSIIILQDFAGNMYFEKIRSQAGRTVQLWPMRPDWVKKNTDKDGEVIGYLYTPPGVTPIPYAVEDVLPFCLYDPLNEYFGYPPVAVAARSGDLDNSVTDYVRMLFEKGGVPPGILTSTQPITEAIAERIRAMWREKYGGYANWDAPVVLGYDTKYQNTGLGIQQMGMEILDERSEVRICMVLKVSPTLIGSKLGLDRAIESNVREIQRNWWDNDLLPLYKSFSDVIRDHIVMPEYGDSIDVEWDLDEVPALQEDRDASRKLALEALRAGAITRNQFNAEWGLDDLGDRGNVFIMSSLQVEVPVSTVKAMDEANPDDETGDANQGDQEGEDQESEQEDQGSGKGKKIATVNIAAFMRKEPGTVKTVNFPSNDMKRAEKKIVAAVKKFLTGQKGRVLSSIREQIDHRAGKVENKQNPIQSEFWNEERKTMFEVLFPLFSTTITDQAKVAYDELAGMVDLGTSWDILNDHALQWAEDHTGAVVAQISKTSMDGFLTEFEPWLNSGEPLEKLIESLEQYYGPVRAELVGVTETTRAFALANINTWKQMGDFVEGFDVMTAEDDLVEDICHAAQAENPHSLGADAPPYHVRCRCGVRPVLKAGIGEGGGEFASVVGSDLDGHFEDWANSLSAGSISSMRGYTGSFYSDVNLALRTGSELDDKFKKSLDEIDAAIVASPGLPKNTVLYRHMYNGGDVDNLIKSIQQGKLGPGDTIIDPAFVSTSIKSNVIEYADPEDIVLLTIRAPQGTAGAWLGYSDFSGFDEAEYLLPRNTKMKIVSAQDLGNNAVSIVVEVVP